MSSIDQIFRAEYGRAVAVLVRFLGDIELAEEAVQDAFVTAVQRWPDQGIPPSPAGWIITTAKNRAIDRLRREAERPTREAAAAGLGSEVPGTGSGARSTGSEIPFTGSEADDMLRLIFTCCHPALAPASRVALTLRLIGGLTTSEIARAFLVPEATMAQRISRAKSKIRDAGIPYRVPRDADLPARLGAVLAVLYLIFNEGYAPIGGAALTRTEMTAEAIRLARLLVVLMPDEPEARGLLALMLLIESRRPARVGPGGDPVPLAAQDRSRWDRELIAEGQALVRGCLRRGQPGPYQIQAAINAVHADGITDWQQVLVLYDQLFAMTPTPVVALHRAVAVAEVEGPTAALQIVDGLSSISSEHHVWHVVRADLLRRIARYEEAAAEFHKAATMTANATERRFLLGRAAEARTAAEPGPPPNPDRR
ncbi:RNA polymerase sigma factor [Paractinoplanes ferrugineus]|uniref:RNA polymerase subunit sigma-24 n=1 Tax=Paractinoplanes ferrugineus TaxID=113564 RepID=A0A919J1R7_9ACTN|nr:RNA polymerase sigma factor [Actinoplanes ferrugineus]GIE10854.1 RNA polymerase subunit sigma-24 [Actinoplanes ferrugineus]